MFHKPWVFCFNPPVSSNLSDRHLHILGICGTAMAAIATLARDLGWRVTGSDAKVYPPMSDYLDAMGVRIRPFDEANLEPDPYLVVIGNALSRGNCEVEAVLNRGLAYTSGAQFIGDHLLPGRHAAVVAGTHGKTSTASMLAHVLDHAGLRPGFMIGGIPENFGTGARLGSGDHFVIEGDEYDTAFFDKRSKFLHYHARLLILNNLEYDHADIFPDLDSIKRQFHHLIRTVPSSGRLIVNRDDANLADVLARGCWTPCTGFAQKGHPDAPWQWEVEGDAGDAFRLWHHGQPAMDVSWSMIGVHQVANACAVAAAAHHLGVSYEQIAAGLASFAGVRRRMTLIADADGVKVYDDFAHHPTAIRNVIEALRSSMHGGRLWVAVEPRSNTMRSRVHQETLPGCFDAADVVLFVPPAARGLAKKELLDVDRLCLEIGSRARVLPDAGAVAQHLLEGLRGGDRVLILSNGDFGGLYQRLVDGLRNRSDNAGMGL